MAENNNEIQRYTFEIEEEFDFDNFEIPQLVRRNGSINNNQEIIGYIILDKPIDHIFKEEYCPICLESSEQLYPLKCGHTYCQQDIEKMIDISKSSSSLIQCPLCRTYQTIDSFDEVSNFKVKNLDNCHNLCH